MKFGIFYEHQLPKPWEEHSEYQLMQDSLAQIELADQLGYDYAWEVEHHFLEEYSFLGTRSLFWCGEPANKEHPAEVTALSRPRQISRTVCRSGSRRSIYCPRGASSSAWARGPVAELHPFGTQVRSKRERWVEAIEAIIPMFTSTNWEYHGEFFDFPARNVIPKPYQKPHPPLWVACSNIQTIGQAGQWGMGALGFTFISPEAAKAWVHRYYNNMLHHSVCLADYPTNPNIAMVSGFMCAETDEEAREKAAGWTFFIFALSRYGRKGIDAPGESDLWAEYQDWRHSDKAKEAVDNALVGSPATIREKLWSSKRPMSTRSSC